MSKEFDAWSKGNKGVVSGGILGGLGLLALGIGKHIFSKNKESENKESDEIARMGSYSLHKDVKNE